MSQRNLCLQNWTKDSVFQSQNKKNKISQEEAMYDIFLLLMMMQILKIIPSQTHRTIKTDNK